jgi:hypothetical protein
MAHSNIRGFSVSMDTASLYFVSTFKTKQTKKLTNKFVDTAIIYELNSRSLLFSDWYPI